MSNNGDVSSALGALKLACEKRVYRSFKDLQPGEYIVKKFCIMETAHGQRLRIEIDDSTYMILPERFAETLDEEKISVLNQTPKIMVYGGKDSTNHDRLILDFRDSSYYGEIFNFSME